MGKGTRGRTHTERLENQKFEKRNKKTKTRMI